MNANLGYPGRFTVAALLMGVAILAVILLAAGSRNGGSASAAGGGPELALSVTGGAISCSAGACAVSIASSFTLSVDVATRPAGGYVLFQSLLDFGVLDPTASEDGAGPNTCGDSVDNGGGDGADRFDDDCVTVDLIYKPTTQASDEVSWPDLASGGTFRAESGPGLLFHGGVSGILPPLPVSTFEGSIVEVLMTCPALEVTSVIQLVPQGDPLAVQNNGSVFVDPTTTEIVPKVGSLTINCLDIPTPTATPTLTPTTTPTPTATPDPTDTDGDGCSDQRENGPDETMGGQRDFQNPWDFYDVLGFDSGPPDGTIDLPNDILGVILHFSPFGYTPGTPSVVGSTTYDAFDRGPRVGEGPYNLTAPDGVIDLPNDILGVILQFNHSCI